MKTLRLLLDRFLAIQGLRPWLGAMVLISVASVAVGGAKTYVQVKAELQDEFTMKCDEVCESKPEVAEDLKPHCQRGCQYFNILFLVSASNKQKVDDISTTTNKCQNSCSAAYTQTILYDSCAIGCYAMRDEQQRAPFINGWLVYMGTKDSDVVLLQPEFDIPSHETWIHLESIFNRRGVSSRLDDYYNNEEEPQRVDSVPVHSGGSNYDAFTVKLCILFVLVTCIVVFLMSRSADTLEEQEQALKRIVDDEYRVSMSHNTYFYPMPAVPPPRYNEAMEAMLEPRANAGGPLPYANSAAIINVCPDKVDC